MHILFKCVYVCAGVHLCVPHYIGANAGHKLLTETECTGDCELSVKGAGNQIHVLYKSSIHS